MPKRTDNTLILDGITKQQQARLAAYIAARVETGSQAFVVAGVEVLQKEFGFTKDQLSKWATATMVLGAKYLKAVKVDEVGNGRIENTDTKVI